MIVKLNMNGTSSGWILVVGLEVTFSGDNVDVLLVVRRAYELPCSVVVVSASVGLELVVAE